MNKLFFITMFLYAFALKAQTYTVGEQVQAYYATDGKWYNAKIVKVDGARYFISWDGYGSNWDTWIEGSNLRTRSVGNSSQVSTTNVSTDGTVSSQPKNAIETRNGTYFEKQLIEFKGNDSLWYLGYVNASDGSGGLQIKTIGTSSGSYLSTNNEYAWNATGLMLKRGVIRPAKGLPYAVIKGSPNAQDLKDYREEMSPYALSIEAYQNSYYGFYPSSGTVLQLTDVKGGNFNTLRKQLKDVEAAYKIVKANYANIPNEGKYYWEGNPQFIIYLWENRAEVLGAIFMNQQTNHSAMSVNIQAFLNTNDASSEGYESYRHYFAMETGGLEALKKERFEAESNGEEQNNKTVASILGLEKLSIDYTAVDQHFATLKTYFEQNSVKTFTNLYVRGESGITYDAKAKNAELEAIATKEIKRVYPGIGIEKIATEKNEWDIVKNEYGIPKYAYQYVVVLATVPNIKHKVMFTTTITRSYAGNGTYNVPKAECPTMRYFSEYFK